MSFALEKKQISFILNFRKFNIILNLDVMKCHEMFDGKKLGNKIKKNTIKKLQSLEEKKILQISKGTLVFSFYC